MAKVRRRRPNLPKPAPFYTEEEPQHDEAPLRENETSYSHHFDEPVFEEEADDARFGDPSSVGSVDRSDVFAEPVFDSIEEDDPADFDESRPKAIAVGGASIGSALSSPQKSSAIQSPVEPEGDYQWNEPEPVVAGRQPGRRLGRTTPFWLMGAGVALVFVLAIWLLFFRDTGSADRQLSPAPGLVGSAALSEAESEPVVDPTPEVAPTATPAPILNVGQTVVVANTAGAGIRLRSEPGTAGTTLAIYQEGDRFTVLNPDGEYSSYPVEADNYRWYRIQIADNPDENLTGWAAGDFLVASE
jgi:hypothetical protein